MALWLYAELAGWLDPKSRPMAAVPVAELELMRARIAAATTGAAPTGTVKQKPKYETLDAGGVSPA